MSSSTRSRASSPRRRAPPLLRRHDVLPSLSSASTRYRFGVQRVLVGDARRARSDELIGVRSRRAFRQRGSARRSAPRRRPRARSRRARARVRVRHPRRHSARRRLGVDAAAQRVVKGAVLAGALAPIRRRSARSATRRDRSRSRSINVNVIAGYSPTLCGDATCVCPSRRHLAGVAGTRSSTKSAARRATAARRAVLGRRSRRHRAAVAPAMLRQRDDVVRRRRRARHQHGLARMGRPDHRRSCSSASAGKQAMSRRRCPRTAARAAAGGDAEDGGPAPCRPPAATRAPRPRSKPDLPVRGAAHSIARYNHRPQQRRHVGWQRPAPCRAARDEVRNATPSAALGRRRLRHRRITASERRPTRSAARRQPSQRPGA